MDINLLAFLDDLNKDIDQLLQEWEQKAERIQAAFPTKDLQKLNANNPDQLFEFLKEVLHVTALFMENEMKGRLTAFGMERSLLRWIIPLKAILSELDKIEVSGDATLPKAAVLVYIKAHLDASWLTDLQIAFGYTDTVNKKKYSPSIKSIIHRLYRNRNKQTGQFPTAKNHVEQTLINMILFLEAETGMSELVEKLLKQLSGGNTKKIFLWLIVNSDEVHPRTNQFYRSFYWLFALINPHIHFMTEDEFYSQTDWISQTYPEYQAKTVKNLIR
jgi:hypothetical protein